jgi:hypothetical protein
MQVSARRRLVGPLATCCVLATGCSSGGGSSVHRPARPPAPAAAASRVTLSLLGGGTPVRMRSCGFSARYRTYRFGGYVHYTGRVTPAPSGAWRVKVKLKRCIPHGYSETFFEWVRGRPDGTFTGIVPTLNPNTFYVRADYERPGGTVRSPLAFFRTAGHG